MMAVDSLHVAVHLIAPSGVSFCRLSPCRRACSAGADPAYPTPHFALLSTQPSHVQASCLEHGWPAAVAAFAGALTAGAAAPPGRRCREREPGVPGEAKAEGKIKGRGTQPLENLVCTWGWRGTLQGGAACRESAQYLIGIGESACFARLAALALDGGTS